MNRMLKRRLVAAGIVVAVAVAAMVAVLWVLPGRFSDGTASSPSGAPSGAPSVLPSKTGDTMVMGLAHIPTSNSCLLCHLTGGDAGLKPIPALGHPLEGWTSCLTCHTNEKLGRSAPGHNGIQESECVNCHQLAPPGPAITQAHARLDEPCLSCHGNVAHLPSSMVGRNQQECWLCHKPAEQPPPQYPHPDDTRLTCRECHRSEDVGGLPIDHSLRQDSTCVLCHDIRRESDSPSLPFPEG